MSKPRFSDGQGVAAHGPFRCECGGTFAISEDVLGIFHSLPTCVAYDAIDINAANCLELILTYMRNNRT